MAGVVNNVICHIGIISNKAILLRCGLEKFWSFQSKQLLGQMFNYTQHLWYFIVIQDVAIFLQEVDGVDIFLEIILGSKSSRLTVRCYIPNTVPVCTVELRAFTWIFYHYSNCPYPTQHLPYHFLSQQAISIISTLPHGALVAVVRASVLTTSEIVGSILTIDSCEECHFSAESHGFSPGVPVPSHRESWQGINIVT
jgi:hypothetical protein